MRSSKQRQRNKQNRQNRPSGGNIINRVFDSSGPEGKVRGTPAQIIEKYQQLHRDAQLAGDRVNAENFAQHAEHYTRLLAEAQRDVDRQREEQEQFQRERQQERERHWDQNRGEQNRGDQPRGDGFRVEQNRGEGFRGDQGRGDQPRSETFRGDQPRSDQPRVEGETREPREGRGNRDRDGFRDFRDRDRPNRFRQQEEAQNGTESMPSFLSQPSFPVLVADPEDDRVPDAGLVETPEARREEPRGDRPRRFDRERRPRRDDREPTLEAAPQPAPVAAPVAEVAAEVPAGEAPKLKRPRRPRTAPADAPATPDAAE